MTAPEAQAAFWRALYTEQRAAYDSLIAQVDALLAAEADNGAETRELACCTCGVYCTRGPRLDLLFGGMNHRFNGKPCYDVASPP